MKLKLFLFLFFVSATSLFAQEQGYNLNFKLQFINNKEISLFGYYGGSPYLIETSSVKSGKIIEFKNKSTVLPSGFYHLENADGEIFLRFLVEKSRNFVISMDKPQDYENAIIQNSEENLIYYQYLNTLNAKKDLLVLFEDNLLSLSPNTLLSHYIATERVWNTIYLTDEDGNEVIYNAPDLTHFREILDQIDFTDPYLVYTDSYLSLDWYLLYYIPQEEDSIVAAMELVLEKVAHDERLRNYFLNHFYIIFDTGDSHFDAAMVFLYQMYCQTENCQWLKDYEVRRLTRIYNQKIKTMPGSKIPVLEAYNKDRQLVSSAEIKEAHIVLWFWDPDCDDCVELTPRLYEFYQEHKEDCHFEVMAISVTEDYDRWIRLVDELGLDWINVSYAMGEPNYDFVDFFGLVITPGIFILDREHKIIARQFPLTELFQKLKMK